MPCSDHGSDALIWAAGRGDSELPLVEELLELTGGAGVDRETTMGDTALTIASARRVDVARRIRANGGEGCSASARGACLM